MVEPFDRSAFRDLYPWRGKYFEVAGGHRMHYLDEGRGKPLLMLHGNPTWSFYYRHLVSAFSASHRTIVPDHIGCGLSDKPSDEEYEYVLERRITDIDALVRHLDLRDITLVAHDWGGMIGLGWALQNLDRVEKVVLSNTAGFPMPASKILPWQIGVVRHLPGFSLPIRGFNAFVRGALATCTTRPLDAQAKQGYLAPYGSWKERIAIQRFVEDIPLQPSDRSYPIVAEVGEKLEALSRLPVLLAWGAKDYVFDDDYLAEFQRRLPHAQVQRFADAGHWVLEDAHEAIVPVLSRFLEAEAA